MPARGKLSEPKTLYTLSIAIAAIILAPLIAYAYLIYPRINYKLLVAIELDATIIFAMLVDWFMYKKVGAK